MKLTAWGLLLCGLAIFAFSFSYDYSWLARSNPYFLPRPKGNSIVNPNADYWVYPGDTDLNFYKKREPEFSSIQGLARLTNPKIDIIVLGPTGAIADNSTTFRTYENIPTKSSKPDDSWGDKILSKGNITVSKAKIDLEIVIKALPKDEDLWGRNAKAVITGRYMYPTTTGDKTASGDKKFTEISTPDFREEITFRFASRAEQEKYESARRQYEQNQTKVDSYNRRVGWFYFFSRLVGFVIGIGLIGIAVWLFIRSKRQKLKTS